MIVRLHIVACWFGRKFETPSSAVDRYSYLGPAKQTTGYKNRSASSARKRIYGNIRRLKN
jgi:hypothetical protein